MRLCSNRVGLSEIKHIPAWRVEGREGSETGQNESTAECGRDDVPKAAKLVMRMPVRADLSPRPIPLPVATGPPGMVARCLLLRAACCVLRAAVERRGERARGAGSGEAGEWGYKSQPAQARRLLSG